MICYNKNCACCDQNKCVVVNKRYEECKDKVKPKELDNRTSIVHEPVHNYKRNMVFK